MAKNNATYWKERFAALEDAQYRKSIEYYHDVEKQFRMATNNVQMDMEKWYNRLAENNGVSYASAKKMLKKNEVEEFHWTLEEYIKKGQENAVNQKWMKELENASAKVHIERLEAMKLQMQQHAELLSAQYLNRTTAFLRNTYADNFYRTAYEMQKEIGIGTNLAKLDTRTIDKIIQQPWASDGANFSDRIWNNKEKLVRNLHTELTQSIIRGENPSKAADRLASIMGVSKKQASNLVFTESAAISASARQDCFQELEVEEFEVVETLDSKTCEYCQDMDGKHYPMEHYKIGETVPPFHPRCRGTTCPYFEDEFTVDETRAARGEDGKTYYVPADMKYKEWKEKYVAKDRKGDILKSKGALSDKNDPLGSRREKHAILFYEAIRNNNKYSFVKRISENTGISEKSISSIYDHVFLNEYELYGGYKRFDPDYDMAESFRRLREGKNIQEHDIIMLKHERLEYELMKKMEMNYVDAHKLTEQKYNYAKALQKFKRKNGLE